MQRQLVHDAIRTQKTRFSGYLWTGPKRPPETPRLFKDLWIALIHPNCDEKNLAKATKDPLIPDLPVLAANALNAWRAAVSGHLLLPCGFLAVVSLDCDETLSDTLRSRLGCDVVREVPDSKSVALVVVNDALRERWNDYLACWDNPALLCDLVPVWMAGWRECIGFTGDKKVKLTVANLKADIKMRALAPVDFPGLRKSSLGAARCVWGSKFAKIVESVQ